MNNINESTVENFIEILKRHEKMTNVFNPWKDFDETYDLDNNAVKIRCQNLKNYLISRKNAKYVLIAEAPGYQGCHFSGIPMTSERIFKKYNLHDMERSSCKDKLKEKRKAKTIQRDGFTEPTATIVWSFLNSSKKLKTTDFVLWNAFPFHPHKKDQLLSNRKPVQNELNSTRDILDAFLKLFKNAKVIPIGNIAANLLEFETAIRHPSNGGKKKFEAQMRKLLS